MTRPELKQFKHARGYMIWMTRWYDGAGKRQVKTFGKVDEVPRKRAQALFDYWIEHEWTAKEHVKNPSGGIAQYTVKMLADAYEKVCEQIYRKNGKSTSHIWQVRAAMEALRTMYGHEPATAIGAPEIAKARDYMIDSEGQKGEPIKLARKTVNGRLVIIKQAFAWARERGLVTQNTLVDIQCVKPLAFGRSEARESRAVTPVSDAAVEKTLAVCTSVLQGMIKVQLYTGMRPGELVALKPGLINRKGDVWIYNVPPEVYKMAHKENLRRREVYIGPKAQGVLGPFLKGRDDEAYVFSPYESELERRAERNKDREHKRLDKCESKKTGTFRRARFKKGSGYTTGSYRKAIKYACRRAEIPGWHPNQIRHTTGTDVRAKFGIEAASLILGHTNLRTTEIYAEANREKAKAVAKQMG